MCSGAAALAPLTRLYEKHLVCYVALLVKRTFNKPASYAAGKTQ